MASADQRLLYDERLKQSESNQILRYTKSVKSDQNHANEDFRTFQKNNQSSYTQGLRMPGDNQFAENKVRDANKS